ncbi:MAG TPA: type 1 glutamine amidotransferase [Kineosporiaceae bacterium]|nr:type 1 glutamine amidotransferase [Kineosporiaceae bacterium]
MSIPDDRAPRDAASLPRVLVVQNEPDGGLGRMDPILREVADLDVRRPDEGDRLPPDLSGYDGLVVLGGAMGATDDDVAPWLPATRRLMAAGVEDDLPTLGVCLGAQLLAAATGGRVELGIQGLEVGVVPVAFVRPASDDALLGPVVDQLGERPPAAQFHQDGITELPPGAVLLASGERYPHQAFRLGSRAWGLQYHPEVTLADFTAWLRDGHGSVQAAGLDGVRLAEAFAAAEPQLAALAGAHARSFAAVVTGARQRA